MKNRFLLASRNALASAVLAALGTAAFDAQALGLGRLNVQSALGEGLRAEIDITSLSAEESASLAVRIASPETYRSAGVDYNAVLAGTQALVVRGPDGRVLLRLSSDRAVQEPFIDLILELNWSAGRLVREFTLLFDPPGNRAAAAALVAPMISTAPLPAASAAAIRPAPRTVATTDAVAPAALAAALGASAGVAVPKLAAPAASKAVAPPAALSTQRYSVRPGDTLYGVAGRTQAAGVSLDQMLVGLYRANPQAFIEHNVNRLRAGAVLSVPSADEVADVSSADLQRLIRAQSVDFGAYRGRLAQAAPQAQAQEPGRQAQGKLQAAVDDRKQSSAASPDKLKLSGGAASAPEAQMAQAAERQDNATRLAELSRNVEALKKLQQGAVAEQGLPAAASAAAQASGPASAAVLAQPVAVASKPVLKPVAAPEAGLIDSLSTQAWLLPGAGLLALVLAGLGAWRLRGRFGKTAGETSFLESRLQPDSFFGASGGQQIDTRDATRASTMGYSLSQIDAIGDVDPVAEADVYLAYGRDLQAEEILKEALRSTPDRTAIHTKLLEVYAKRRDSKGFEALATQLHALSKGTGEDWAAAQSMGHQLDPNNPLYQPGGGPQGRPGGGLRGGSEPVDATEQGHADFSQTTLQAEDSRLPQIVGDGLDLDLGQIDKDRSAASPQGSDTRRPIDPGLDFEYEASPARPADAGPAGVAELDLDALSLDEGDTLQAALGDAGDTLLDFGEFLVSEPGELADDVAADLDELAAGDPLQRKLELAEEFRQIGDLEGARDLLEELLVKASGSLRSQAQAMLDALG